MSASRSPKPSSPRHVDVLGMETAFLIVTAASRDFDLSKWFNEKAYDGKIPLREFDAKIISLSTAMGINQSIEIKKELEIATSPVSLRTVHRICSAGEDLHGELLIDLHLLFKLSQQKVEKYMRELQQDNDEENKSDLRSWREGEYDIHGQPISTNPSVVNQTPTSPKDQETVFTAAAYLSEIQEISEKGQRPVSAVAGGRGEGRGESTNDALRNNDTDDKINTPSTRESDMKVSKNKRYDEEVEFSQSEYEDMYVEEKDDGPRHSAPPIPPSVPSPPTDWVAENRRLLHATPNPHATYTFPTDNSLSGSLPRPPRPQSAEPASGRGRS
eukprot:gene35149-42572_t